MKYCVNCEQMVEPVNDFSWVWFLFWLIIGAGWGGVIYFAYWALFKSKVCPICRSKCFQDKRPQ